MQPRTSSLEAIFSEDLQKPAPQAGKSDQASCFLGVMEAAEVIETYLPLSKRICGQESLWQASHASYLCGNWFPS